MYLQVPNLTSFAFTYQVVERPTRGLLVELELQWS